MNYRDSRGMSYIEVLVSAVILSVIILPLTEGFRQASASYLSSQNIYQAATNCSNILLSAERTLKKSGFPVSGGTIEEFLNDKDFSNTYNLERFNYILRISEINNDGQLLTGLSFSNGFVTSAEAYPELDLESDLEIEGINFASSESLTFENLIVYDTNFFVSDCPYAEFSGDTCRISVNQPGISINFDARTLANPVTFELYNGSAGILSLNIFTDGNSESIHDLVKIVSSGNGRTAVCFSTMEFGKNYLITVDVYDKKGRLLNRAAKLI